MTTLNTPPDDALVMAECVYGHVDIVSTRRWVGPRREILGGYAIYYDRHGKETHRTEDTPNIVVTWPEPACPSWWEIWK